jgi:hypothetical protein
LSASVGASVTQSTPARAPYRWLLPSSSGQQFHDELFVARVTPAIAVDATDQCLTVVVDFDKWALALGAITFTDLYSFEQCPSL